MRRVGKHSTRVKELRRRVRDRRLGEVVVDGRRLVADLVRWDIPLRELYLTPEAASLPEAEAWIAAAGRVFELEAPVLARIAPTRAPQGVLAVAAEPAWPAWRAGRGVAVWLDGVQDPGNLGAVLRSAAGLGAEVVLLSPGCADPFGPAAVRGAAGAAFRIPVERDVTFERAARRVRERGGEVWAAAGTGTPVADWRPAEPLLLLLGAEGAGLSGAALEAADGRVTIALGRDIDSLNVAVAAGVLLQRLS